MPKSENQVEAEVARFMADHGWRRQRNHVGQLVTADRGMHVAVGKRGDPDWTYKRSTGTPGLVQICHFEAKAEGKRPSGKHGQEQLERIAQLNYLGEPACWANSLAMFEAWYLEHFT